jgi:hypothetical protein
MNSASLSSLAGRYDNPLPPRFLAPIDSLKIPALSINIGSEAKYKVPDWWIKYRRLWHRAKVDSGIGLPNAHGKCVGVDSGGDIR